MIAVINFVFYPPKMFITPIKLTTYKYTIAKIETVYFEILLKNNVKSRDKAYKKLLKLLKTSEVKWFYTKDTILKSYLICQNFISPDINNFLQIKMCSAVAGILKTNPNIFRQKTASIITNDLSSISRENINLLAKYFSCVIIITNNMSKFEQLREDLLLEYGVVVMILDLAKISKIDTDFVIALNNLPLESLLSMPDRVIKIIPCAPFNKQTPNLITSFSYNVKLKHTMLYKNISKTAISALLYYAAPGLSLPIKNYYQNSQKINLNHIITNFDDNNNQKVLK